MNQTIIWTTLPNGFGEDKAGRKTARLSVYVSPRLTTSHNQPTTLAEFPHFVAWPSNATEFRVEFKGSDPVPAKRVSDSPDNELWTALLPPTTPVNSYSVRSFSHRQLVSSPMAELAKNLIDTYSVAANRWPAAIPKASDWNNQDLFSGLVKTPTALREPLRTLGAQFVADLAFRGDVKTIHAAITGIESTPGTDQSELQDLHQLSQFAQAIHFLNPQTARRNDWLPVARPPDLDFHHLLAALAEYPVILRKLGIVIDLEIDPSAVSDSARLVRVAPHWRPSDIETVTPWTLLDPTRFKPATKNGEAGSGFLPIGRPESPYSLIEVDVHGGAVKVLQTMRDAARDAGRGKKNEAKGLPGLRTGGISVAMTGRATDFHHRTLASDQLQQELVDKQDSILSAQDLTRGYRVDVLGGTQHWLSLCRRDGRYYIHQQGGFTDSDEGTITAAVTQNADPSVNDPRIYFPQTLFRWTGWSLSVPKPGKTVGPKVQNSDEPAVPGLHVSFSVPPGSLPALRFGRHYRLRMRQVDLAGNSLPLETTLEDAHYFLQDKFYRFEPINPPALVPLMRARPGEAIERIVVRSTPNSPLGDICDRVLMPPQTSESIMEQHGMFDGVENAKLVMLRGAWKDMRDNREKSLGVESGLHPGASKGDIFRGIPCRRNQSYVPARPGGGGRGCEAGARQ